MGEVYSHLSEEERRAIQIEIGDGTSVRKIARLLGRSPSGISREIKRNTWVPVRRERVLPAVPAETAEDGPVDGRMLHRRPRAAQGRPQARQTAQAPPPVMRTPVGAGGRMAGSRPVATARRRARQRHARQRHRVRPPHAPARRAGHGHVLRRPVLHRQRGGNENRNGMIRRYPPKRGEIRMDMAGELREIVDEADNRPMRVLDYRTPAEAFADELLELQDQQGCCTSK